MIRSFQLARIAFEAETLRLKRMAKRTSMRLVLAVAAVPFLMAVLAFFEVALWSYVASQLIAPFAALILAGVNIVVAMVLLLAAAMASDSHVEIEALKVRQRALEDMSRQLTVAAMVIPATRFVLGQLVPRRSRR